MPDDDLDTLQIPDAHDDESSSAEESRAIDDEIIAPPEYFYRIREEASKCWDQLDSNKQLAGPWHQRKRPVMAA